MWKNILLAACATFLTFGSAASAELVFFDGFESGMSEWQGWTDVYWEPGTAGCNQPKNCWGPQPLFQSDNHPRPGGTKCARQEQAQPWWYGSVHMISPELPLDKTVRLSVWQFEDANPMFLQPATNPPAPGDPRRYHDHDQVQGWVAIMGDYNGDVGGADEWSFFAIGVHAHWASPAPVLDWWQNLSWSTGPNPGPVHDWYTTTVPRVQGFRRLDIWVHPYTGGDDDVEFFINGEKVGQGPRKLDPEGGIMPLNKIGLGASPAHMGEDYIANSYEFFWYDDVKLTVGVLGDFDGNGFVDGADYGLFSSCFNGSDNVVPVACREADFDNDGDVDGVDFGVFAFCLNGTGNPPPPGCG